LDDAGLFLRGMGFDEEARGVRYNERGSGNLLGFAISGARHSSPGSRASYLAEAARSLRENEVGGGLVDAPGVRETST
jgi:hypothetical protein